MRINTLESGNLALCMEKDTIKRTYLFTMESLLIGLGMDQDKRDSLKETPIKENIKMDDSMDLEPIAGLIPHFTKDPSKMVLDTEKANGLTIKQSILEITLKESNKVMDNFIFQVEISIKATLSTTKDKPMVRCFGQMDPSIKVNGKMEFKMERDRFIFLEDKS